MNPLKVADYLRCVGEGLDAQILPNWVLLVACKSEEQEGK